MNEASSVDTPSQQGSSRLTRLKELFRKPQSKIEKKPKPSISHAKARELADTRDKL